MSLVRFGVSMDMGLLEEFDRALAKEGFANRSEALRHLVRRFVSERRWENLEGDVLGAVTIVYDHTVRDCARRLLELEHTFRTTIASTTHVHCNTRTCLEVILVRGNARSVASFVRELQGLKGVKSCQVTCVSPHE
ncbi:MAG: nickel-responsive transcriptional regulator NikR [Candidatus Caldatribacterium sp.]|uniref:nickel-responsive transcriptional regulator NikR n=1 Tax=Candidatus Caldatribacterium sp. TaxID=2282143 RepID=UPI002995DAE4|nr:nickel-responsive transcriptional regulator NikR [Candidatus Caldatribacterium sp.]MCX7730364.1 nickel-responsive transcriptional regulator NikR [Candidatus Caldatribacterium sp.]MDW8081823.1 nickel-responsive transcriptional regulator NikR [Candidatus Calescibacterium sp.]